MSGHVNEMMCEEIDHHTLLTVLSASCSFSCHLLTHPVPWSPYGTTLQLVFNVLAQKELIETWIFWVRLTGVKSVF